jgi:multiple antibiotic resistance protein
MQISGGIVLFILGMNMIFPKKDPINYGLDGEPFIFPLAVPLVAGPAVLAAVMILSKQEISNFALIYAIFIAWVATSIILLLAGKLSTWIDPRGLSALERLMGLILLMLAIEMFLNGLGDCIESSQNLKAFLGN